MSKTKKLIQMATEIWRSDTDRRPQSITFGSIADLADALNRAKTAHGEFERGLGQADHNWPLWYAAYIAMEQGLIERPVCKLAQTEIQVQKGPEAFITPQTKSPGDLPARPTPPNHTDSSWGYGSDDGSKITTGDNAPAWNGADVAAALDEVQMDASDPEEYWAAH